MDKIRQNIDQMDRVRALCMALEGVSEKPSHGEPTWWVAGRTFVMFANNHHGDGRIAVWLPVHADLRPALLEQAPGTFFIPPYVGTRGWIGMVLDAISDEDLAYYIRNAWQRVAHRAR